MKKKFEFKINGNIYNTEIITVEDNIAEIDVNGTKYQVELTDRIKPTPKTPKLVRSQPIHVETPQPIKSTTGAHVVKSPLPGIVLDIEKRVGDVVKAGEVILLLEDMKMENNIEADKDGTLVSFSVDKGATIMEGDVLFTIG